MCIENTWKVDNGWEICSGESLVLIDTKAFKERAKVPLDEMLARGQLTVAEYEAALDYLYAWRQYMHGIQAPLMRTTCFDVSTLKGSEKSEAHYIHVKNQWREIQDRIKGVGRHQRHLAEQIICYDMPCEDVRALKAFLQALMIEHKKR